MNEMMAIDASGGLGKPGAYNLSSLDPALTGKASRPYVAAMCSVNDPSDALLAPVARQN